MSEPIQCPACSGLVAPVRRKLPGIGGRLAFGRFCPVDGCGARLDHVLAEQKHETPTTPDAPAALRSAREIVAPLREPPRRIDMLALPSRGGSTSDLKQDIRARRRETKERVEVLRRELDQAEQDLSLFERITALFDDGDQKDAAE